MHTLAESMAVSDGISSETTMAASLRRSWALIHASHDHLDRLHGVVTWTRASVDASRDLIASSWELLRMVSAGTRLPPSGRALTEDSTMMTTEAT